jgi:hypothetical protein
MRAYIMISKQNRTTTQGAFCNGCSHTALTVAVYGVLWIYITLWYILYRAHVLIHNDKNTVEKLSLRYVSILYSLKPSGKRFY